MPVTLGEIAQKTGGTLLGDPAVAITGVAGIETAGPGQLTFVANQKYRSLLVGTQATAVIISPDVATDSIKTALIQHPNPYYAFLVALRLFHPQERLYPPGIHSTAVVGKNVTLAEGVHLGPCVVLAEGVSVGEHSALLSGTYVGRNSKIGNDCLIYPNVTAREGVTIGDRVIVHSGTVVGSDGFGFAKEGGVYHKIPQVGGVVVEDDVEIGANTTIDRATMGNTIIGRGTKIDNLVQIAHNVAIGENSIIVAQVGISGSTKIGKNVTLAGQVGLVGHLTIGDNVIVAAKSGIHRDLKPGTVYFGYPARELSKQKRIEAVISRLPELAERVKALEKKVKELTGQVQK